MSEYKPKTKKRSFLLYYNNVIPALKMLPDNEDLGELFRALCNYEMYGEVPEDFRRPQTESLFELITLSLQENHEKWLARCEINKEIADNRTNGTNGTKHTDKDKEKDIDKEKDKEKAKDKEKESRTNKTNINAVMNDVIAHIGHG